MGDITRKHNDEMAKRADKPAEKVKDEDVENDKVSKGFWQGEYNAEMLRVHTTVVTKLIDNYRSSWTWRRKEVEAVSAFIFWSITGCIPKSCSRTLSVLCGTRSGD